MRKKVTFCTALFIVWLVVLLILAFGLVACGLVSLRFGWGTALGTSCGHPQLWLIAIGVVMLLRSTIHKMIFQEKKEFKKLVAIVVIVLGCFWLIMNLGARMLFKATESRTLENENVSVYLQDKNKNLLISKEELKNIEDKYIDFCVQFNKQLPLKIDDVTTLKIVTFTNMTMSVYYSVETNAENFTETELKELMDSLREHQKKQIPIMLSNGDYDISQSEIYELFKKTGMKFRFVYHDLNNHQIGANQFDFLDFK